MLVVGDRKVKQRITGREKRNTDDDNDDHDDSYRWPEGDAKNCRHGEEEHVRNDDSVRAKANSPSMATCEGGKEC